MKYELHGSNISAQTSDLPHLPALVREKQLRKDFIQIAHGTLWDWVAKGTFPAPIKLSSGVSAWKCSDLQAWANGTWLGAA
jgi:predicted DNA-binding transcriptional regulator AlpA